MYVRVEKWRKDAQPGHRDVDQVDGRGTGESAAPIERTGSGESVVWPEAARATSTWPQIVGAAAVGLAAEAESDTDVERGVEREPGAGGEGRPGADTRTGAERGVGAEGAFGAGGVPGAGRSSGSEGLSGAGRSSG